MFYTIIVRDNGRMHLTTGKGSWNREFGVKTERVALRRGKEVEDAGIKSIAWTLVKQFDNDKEAQRYCSMINNMTGSKLAI